MERNRVQPAWKSRAFRGSTVLSLAGGVAYGLLIRAAFSGEGWFGSNVATLSIGFLFLVPAAVGYLVSHGADRPSWPYSLFMPWLVCLLFVAVSLALAWEGWICSLMAVLLSSSVGGAVGRFVHPRSTIDTAPTACGRAAAPPADRSYRGAPATAD
jgi:hypothetical protein